ncbi:MAG: hypothetical protein HPY66_1741 [Firmicutes bacterium]|nr:hypothetical protein [Bacillota bacterium]
MSTFLVDANGVLQPIGVLVAGDSRYELLPGVREYTEEIPGLDGEIDFGSEFKARVLELHCVLEILASQQPAKIREIASYLNPAAGVSTLTFADDPGKVYFVKCSGTIEVTRNASWIEFTIPFKMTNPFIMSATTTSLIGTGTAANGGNAETPFLLTVAGPVTNPSVVVANYTMAYTGTVEAGQTLTIDTEKLTVKIGETNALGTYNRVFPTLQPGNNAVTAAAAGITTLTWYSRWI